MDGRAGPPSELRISYPTGSREGPSPRRDSIEWHPRAGFYFLGNIVSPGSSIPGARSERSLAPREGTRVALPDPWAGTLPASLPATTCPLGASRAQGVSAASVARFSRGWTMVRFLVGSVLLDGLEFSGTFTQSGQSYTSQGMVLIGYAPAQGESLQPAPEHRRPGVRARRHDRDQLHDQAGRGDGPAKQGLNSLAAESQPSGPRRRRPRSTSGP